MPLLGAIFDAKLDPKRATTPPPAISLLVRPVVSAALLVVVSGCGPSQPGSCAELEAKAAAADAPPACAIADDCKEGGDNYRTREGADACETSCEAVLEGGGCDPVADGEGEA